MASALASLTANYTDSEGEEDRGSEGEGDEMHPTLAERLGKMGREGSPSGTPGSSTSGKSVGTPLARTANSAGGTPSKKAKLVSYADPDAGLSDDETEPVPMDLGSDDDDKENDALVEKENVGVAEEDDVKERSHIMEELWEGGVKLPPEPSGHCSKDLQEKFEDLHRKKVELGYDFNHIIRNKKAFRNPSIYDKLILHCNIDELGTNFPPELYDGHLFGKESYYEELAKVQKVEMDRREKALEAKKKLGDNRLKDTHPAQQHRKSKWDQQVMRGGAAMSHLPSSKVIPAFGSLKQKK